MKREGENAEMKDRVNKQVKNREPWRPFAPSILEEEIARVVRRSNALSSYAYGRDFRYDERMSTGRGVKAYGRDGIRPGVQGAPAASALAESRGGSVRSGPHSTVGSACRRTLSAPT